MRLLSLGVRSPLDLIQISRFALPSQVDSFHAIRRSDPPFLPPLGLLQNGLPPLVTFLVTHFTDARIANPDVRDVLLQSISVLLNYKEYVAAFERNRAARESLIPALLHSFDNRFWIPISNILLRMVKVRDRRKDHKGTWATCGRCYVRLSVSLPVSELPDAG